MKEVFVAGLGRTAVSRGLNHRPEHLAAAAVRECVQDSGINPADIDALYVGNMTSGILSGQLQLGAVVAERSGLSGLEALTIEAACASGGAAMRTGFMTVAGGMHKAVLVCGAELLAHAEKQDATSALATAADYELESSQSETFVSLNAKLMQLYMERYGIEGDRLAGFAVNAHRNAMSNPLAMFHKRISADDYSTSRLVHDPLRLYDISPICDGAAAVLLVDADIARSLGADAARIQVAASSVATMPVGLNNRRDPLDLEAARASTDKAFAQAGIARSDIDLFEVHDAYTVMTALTLEASGFAEPGRGWELANAERTGLGGELPIATFGGLKARGHPVGATGVYQIAEATLQLRGAAGANQVADASTALAQNVGGTASTIINHILRRVA